MPKTQYYTATTLDGFIADEHDSLQWLFDVAGGEDPEQGDSGWRDFIDGVGAFAMGSTTWEWVVDHEDLLHHPERWQSAYDDRPCWVFSSKERTVISGLDVRFVSGDVAAVHAEMTEAAAGRNVWIVGGGDLVGQFHDAGLLDEVIATLTPVTLGAGAPLLPRHIEGMQLRDVHRFGPMVTLTYDVQR